MFVKCLHERKHEQAFFIYSLGNNTNLIQLYFALDKDTAIAMHISAMLMLKVIPICFAVFYSTAVFGGEIQSRNKDENAPAKGCLNQSNLY